MRLNTGLVASLKISSDSFEWWHYEKNDNIFHRRTESWLICKVVWDSCRTSSGGAPGLTELMAFWFGKTKLHGSYSWSGLNFVKKWKETEFVLKPGAIIREGNLSPFVVAKTSIFGINCAIRRLDAHASIARIVRGQIEKFLTRSNKMDFLFIFHIK